MSIHAKIQQLSHDTFQTAVDARRHLHRNPELSYKEFKTTEFLVERLTDLGYAVERPLETGCVAVLQGGVTSDRVIALRADIDALPIHEEGEHKKDFMSQIDGVAHCCGHDIHTAGLLGTAQVLSALREEVPGKVVLVFQPGEERSPGGGRLIMESGILQRLGVQAIYGLHTYPFLEPGNIGWIKGPMMARPDEIALDVIGAGGHAAVPHKAVDPVVLSAQIITVLQSIVSRHVNPLEPAVLTFGKISGGSAHNVIPESVHILGTIRTFSRETTLKIATLIENTSRAIAQAAGGDVRFTITEGYPAVVNVDWAVDALVQTVGRFDNINAIVLPEPSMGGEDFSFYLEEIPGAFFVIGSGSEETGSNQYNWHHPRYNADERSLLTAMKVMSALVFEPSSIA
jgi:amidohydrolase